jgi:mannosyltransferase OCH1-like enzyme
MGDVSLSIPRLLHRIWLGTRPLSAEHLHFAETWRRLHPGWEMILWTEKNLPRLELQAYFDGDYSFSLKSDIARYEILRSFGGLYLDVDVECQKNMEPLLAGADVVAGFEREGTLCTAVMASVPADPLWDGILRELPGVIEMHGGNSGQAGPVLFSHHAVPCQRVPKLPPAAFYPYGWWEKHRRGETFPEAYAVHHWDGSWTR